MEEVRKIDRHHQALFRFPGNRSQSEADGPIWRTTIDRYILSIAEKLLLLADHVFLRIGTLFRASQFLSEELPIRLAHRVQELGDLPDGLNDMPSIKKVQDWYSQSFEVRRTIC